MLKKGADIISPARVFGFIWSIVLGLANLKLSKLQFPWTFSQWAYVLIGPLSFLIGIFIIYIMYIGSRLHSVSEIRQILGEQKVDHTKLFYLIVLAFILYLIGYIGVALAKGQVPMFSRNPSAARTDFLVFGIAMFIPNMTVILFFSLVYHLFTQQMSTKKGLLKIISFITIISYLFLLQRYQFILITVMAFTFLYYTSRYIRLKTMFLFAILGILLFYLIATLRSGQIIQLALYKTSLMKFSFKYAIFTEPYMYVVMNVENFVNAVSRHDHFTYGAYTFDWLFALIQLKYPIKDYFALVDTPYTIGVFNTHTIFWTFYRDFGILGISLLPLICGLAVGSVYYSMRRNPTIGLVSSYSIIVFVMALSFFINPLGFLWFVYIIAWIVIVLKFIRVKQSVLVP